MREVFQVNRVYLCFHPHYRLLLILMMTTLGRKLCWIYISFAILSFSGSSKPTMRFSEDVDLFLHVDSVYLAKQHLRHQDLLFIPLGEVLWYSEGTVVLHMHCREVCVRVCVDGFYTHTFLPIQQLFRSSFVALSLPLLLADKKMAVATVFAETAIVSWASVEGRLKIISSGAIRNVSRRQSIHSSLLLNCYPTILQGLIKVMLLATPVSLRIYANLAVKDQT